MTATDERDERCITCRYFVKEWTFGNCKRYPHVEVKSAYDWCGEWKERDDNSNR